MSEESRKRDPMPRHRPKAYGVSFDAFYGFPVFLEVSSTLVVCTALGYHNGAIMERRKRSEIPAGQKYDKQ